MEYRYQDIRLTGACSTIIARFFRQIACKPDQDTATAVVMRRWPAG